MIYTQYSRLKHHTLTTNNNFTVPPTEDFTDPQNQWISTDLAISEFGVNSYRKEVYVRTLDEVQEVVTNFRTTDFFLPSNGVNIIASIDMSIYTAAIIDVTIVGRQNSDCYSGKWSNTYNVIGGSPYTINQVGSITITEKTTNQGAFQANTIGFTHTGNFINITLNEKSANTTQWTARINILPIFD